MSQTDRRTDRQRTCDRKTAHYNASRGINDDEAVFRTRWSKHCGNFEDDDEIVPIRYEIKLAAT